MNLILKQHLQTIRDTEFNLTAEELGLKITIAQNHNNLDLTLHANFPSFTLKTSLLPKLHAALQQSLPQYNINLTIQHAIQAHATQLPGKSLRGVKNIIAIASGKGGVGKSTVAVNIATALAKMGARVGLLDADIYGPSVPTMLGDVAPILMQDNNYIPVSAHGILAMSMGYLTHDDSALIWRGPMLAKALLQMLDITAWGNLDYLIIDLPPGTGDIQLSLVQKIPLAGAIIVTTPQNVATLDAKKALDLLHKTNIYPLGVIENMAYHTCTQCGQQTTLFGSGGGQMLSTLANCQLLGQLPLTNQIRQDSDIGQPTALSLDPTQAKPFLTAAIRAALALSIRPLSYADRFPQIVQKTGGHASLCHPTF